MRTVSANRTRWHAIFTYYIFTTLKTVTALILFMPYTSSATQNTFDEDLKRLKQHFAPVVLHTQGRRIAVLAELQGRIMVAATPDKHSPSIGWLNRDFLAQSSIELNGTIGGADRLWFGPDGGQYSVFFDPGVETIADNIRPPKPLTFDAFQLASKTEDTALFKHQLHFKNHLGFEFSANVKRSVSVFDEKKVESDLGIAIPNTIEWVAYGSQNTVTNRGETAWGSINGLFSLWVLGMFEPGATVVIPLRKPLISATNYFSPPSDKQVHIQNNTLFYKADAKFMNKVGVPLEHTTPILGSYDRLRQRLTIIKFSFNPLEKKYVNAVWDWTAPPLKGEAINIFNDGPQENGKPFGPFYEMETSSRALSLSPKESETHNHNTYHFVGDHESLEPIAIALLDVTLAQINQAFSPPQPKH